MPDYGEILAFLAMHPPQLASERRLHASLLELMAQCLRQDGPLDNPGETDTLDALKADLEAQIANAHDNWVHFGG